jgi:uncharacterized protein YciI
MYYLLFYDFAENAVERRAPFREAHLTLASESVAKGTLLLGGAFAEPVDGALLVFEADDEATVLEFVRRDPYVANGIVTSWRVRPWTVAVGSLR